MTLGDIRDFHQPPAELKRDLVAAEWLQGAILGQAETAVRDAEAAIAVPPQRRTTAEDLAAVIEDLGDAEVEEFDEAGAGGGPERRRTRIRRWFAGSRFVRAFSRLRNRTSSSTSEMVSEASRSSVDQAEVEGDVAAIARALVTSMRDGAPQDVPAVPGSLTLAQVEDVVRETMAGGVDDAELAAPEPPDAGIDIEDDFSDPDGKG